LVLRSLQGEVQEGRFLPSAMTVAELGHKWLTEHVQANLKPGAAADYRGTFYRHVAPALGAVRLDDCSPQMVRALLGQERAQGLGAETVAKIRRHIHAMFAFAQDAGLVSVNPADAARARGRRQSSHRARGTELSPVQVKRFLDECSPRWRALFTVALDTGLRRGELIGLCWGDVDLLQRIIYVRRSIGAYDQPRASSQPERQLTTKTEASQRLVPILDGAQAALEELYKDAVNTSDEAPVFVTVERKRGRDGVIRPRGRPLSPRMLTRVFRRYAERSALPHSIRLHDLRHTAITNAIAQGEDILLISAFAGHAKTSTTVDVYGHLMPDRVREAARRMRSVSGRGSAEVAANVPAIPQPAIPKPPIATDEWSDPRSDSRPHRPHHGPTVTMRLEHGLTQTQLGHPCGGQLLMRIDRYPSPERARVRLLEQWRQPSEPRALSQPEQPEQPEPHAEPQPPKPSPTSAFRAPGTPPGL
jgi:integrase